MREITIRSGNDAALKKLEEFLRLFDFEIISQPAPQTKEKGPISYSAEPDFRALAGIWEGRTLSQEELRKQAWGDRL